MMPGGNTWHDPVVAQFEPYQTPCAGSGNLNSAARQCCRSVSMLKGMRVLLSAIFLSLVVATVLAEDRASTGASRPPVAPQKPVIDTIQNHRIVDPYRWLEDAGSPETQKWVSEELAYTGDLLDPLPGRDQLRKRLGELMSIG